MTVRIPITADAASAVSAFERIRDAIRKAGQEGKAFSEIDLAHPELEDLADDLRKVQENFETLSKVGRGATAAAVRNIGGELPPDVLAWMSRHYQAFPDEADLRRHQATVSRYIFQGTRLGPSAVPPQTPPEPAPPAPPSPAPPPGGGGGGSGGSVMSSLLGGLAGGAGFFLAQAELNSIARVAGQANSQATDEATQTDLLLRNLHDTTESFTDLRNSVMAATRGLALTDAQMQQFTLTWTRLTNDNVGSGALDNARLAAGFARGYGVDQGAMVGLMGRQAMQGMDPREFAVLLGQTVAQAGATGQVTETAQALLRWSENASRYLITHTNVEGFAATYAGMYASGQPGLRGAAGEALLNQINSAIMGGGGGGMPGQVLAYQALARFGVTDPFQVRYQLQGGAFERIPGTDTTNFEAIMSTLQQQFGGANKYQLYDAIGNEFGMTSRQAEGIARGFRLKNSQWGQEQLHRYLPDGIGNVDPSAYAEIFDLLGDKSSALSVRDRLLKRGNLTDEEKNALSSDTGDKLIGDLVRALAEHGMTGTQGSDVADAQAKLSNALTELGRVIVPLTTAVQQLTGQLGDLIARWFGDSAADAEEKIRVAIENSPSLGWGKSLPPSGRQSLPGGGNLVDQMIQIESSGNPTAGDPGHAYGLLGYEPDTWLEDLRNATPGNMALYQATAGRTRAQLLALRSDPTVSRMVANWALGHRIGPRLMAHHLDVTPENEYGAWHFGDNGWAAIMGAPDNTPMSALVSPDAYAHNPDVQGRTAGQYRRMNYARFHQGGQIPASEPQGPGAYLHVRADPITVVHRAVDGAALGTSYVPVTVTPGPPSSMPAPPPSPAAGPRAAAAPAIPQQDSRPAAAGPVHALPLRPVTTPAPY